MKRKQYVKEVVNLYDKAKKMDSRLYGRCLGRGSYSVYCVAAFLVEACDGGWFQWGNDTHGAASSPEYYPLYGAIRTAYRAANTAHHGAAAPLLRVCAAGYRIANLHRRGQAGLHLSLRRQL